MRKKSAEFLCNVCATQIVIPRLTRKYAVNEILGLIFVVLYV